MYRRIPFVSPDRGTEIVQKIQGLDGNAAKDVLNRLYGILSTLDAKANGLLRVNSLFLTILIFFIGWSHASGFPERFGAFVPIAYLDTALLGLSSVLCLFVVAVSWKFLAKVTLGNAGYMFETEIARLANVVDDRTHFYWLAWWGTLLSLLLSFGWWLFQ